MKILTTLFAGLALLSPLAAQDADCCKAKVSLGEPACCAVEAVSDPAAEIQAGLVALLKKSWESDFVVAGSQDSPMADGGKATFDVKGHVTYQDLLPLRLNVEFNMSDPMQGEMSGSAVIVLNGGIFHAELNLPPEMKAGLPFEIVKIDLSVLPDFEELSSPDAIMAMLEETGALAFSAEDAPKEIEGKEGTRTFSMGDENDGATAVFSAKTWFPISFTAAAKEESQTLKLTVSNSKMVEAFDKGTFDYTPPEGKMVQDMTAMIQMAAMQQGPDMGEEELDF